MSAQAPISMLPLFAPRSEADSEVEQRKAASVLDLLAEERHAWLDRMRNILASIYRARVAKWGEGHPMAYVCADDARRLMRHRPDLALPAGCSPNVMGALFRTREWVRSEHRDHQSSTRGSHGNDLYRWRWLGPGSLR